MPTRAPLGKSAVGERWQAGHQTVPVITCCCQMQHNRGVHLATDTLCCRCTAKSSGVQRQSSCSNRLQAKEATSRPLSMKHGHQRTNQLQQTRKSMALAHGLTNTVGFPADKCIPANKQHMQAGCYPLLTADSVASKASRQLKRRLYWCKM